MVQFSETSVYVLLVTLCTIILPSTIHLVPIRLTHSVLVVQAPKLAPHRYSIIVTPAGDRGSRSRRRSAVGSRLGQSAARAVDLPGRYSLCRGESDT